MEFNTINEKPKTVNDKPQTIKLLQDKLNKKRESSNNLAYMKGTRSQPNFVTINTRTMAQLEKVT